MKSTIFLLLAFWCLTAFGQKSESLARQAYMEFENSNYKKALDLYNKAIKLDNTNGSYYYERAAVYAKLGKYKQAINDYDQAVLTEPQNPDMYFQRGIFFYALQEAEYSINDFNQALRFAGENDTLKYAILNNRGNARAMKRDFAGAYLDYKAVLEFDSLDILALTNIGAVLDDLGRGDEAIAYLEKVIEIAPEFIGGYGNLAFRYIDLGDYDKALAMNNKILELEPDEPIGLNNRGYVYYLLGEYAKALEDVNASLALYPVNSFAYKNRALIYIKMDRIKDACKDLNKAIELGFTERYGDEVEKLLNDYCK